MGRSNGYRRWTINHVLLARAGAMVVRMVGSWDSIIVYAKVDDVKGQKERKVKWVVESLAAVGGRLARERLR